jgi:hypothetical protein
MRRVLVDIDKLRDMLNEPDNNDPFVHKLMSELRYHFEESLNPDNDATAIFAGVLSVESSVRRQLQKSVIDMKMLMPPEPIKYGGARP